MHNTDYTSNYLVKRNDDKESKPSASTSSSTSSANKFYEEYASASDANDPFNLDEFFTKSEVADYGNMS